MRKLTRRISSNLLLIIPIPPLDVCTVYNPDITHWMFAEVLAPLLDFAAKGGDTERLPWPNSLLAFQGSNLNIPQRSKLLRDGTYKLKCIICIPGSLVRMLVVPEDRARSFS